ncbi:MAG: Hsp70 family protein [Candidatus Binatia bacterium]|nr:Hsp70 family protein [Candidatus Binatia bacterium]MDG2009015.1 Hsp70 family protein [Candidatus Binatia bacterium]
MSASPDGSRYVVGIDLGTTNSGVAWIDLENISVGVEMLAIPQVVAAGSVEALTSLPSCLYLPRRDEQEIGSLQSPWGPTPPGVAGTFALRRSGANPDQVIHSAKSWLCHQAGFAGEPLLPEGVGEEFVRISALEASTAYLRHLREAWDWQMAGKDAGLRLEHQDVVLTVPASFDAAAREQTIAAARDAGIQNPQLLEEPQAAVYHWAGLDGARLRENLVLGDSVLVCDVGGGTTDFSLLVVDEQDGELHLERVAVGDHLLLGGDNMDLALAFDVRQKLAKEGTRLDPQQFRSLVASCREGKESLLAEGGPDEFPLTVLARSRKLLGGTIRATLLRADMERLLLGGFFAEVPANHESSPQDQEGLQEIGLPFARDPSITAHLATFLRNHGHQLEGASGPTCLLLNGGVLAAPPIVGRLESVLGKWAAEKGGTPPRLLQGANLAEGVARGAAVFGAARRGEGLRIRSGAARSYYIGMASSMPAVPGQAPAQRSICVVPFGLEEGSSVVIPGMQLGLLLGAHAEFRLYASSTRNDDCAGTLLDEFETEELDELAPLGVELSGVAGARVQVHMESHLTEIGTLEIFFVAEGDGRWQLTFGVRAEGGAEHG